ncbi:MAG: tRNA (uridine(34)/cytosine(34)/5-carboxymethylaminomethyluridine(34)-2'-O)-methyltransferase TrmL [Candidatus Aminicenantes bacterium]|jgi:tRNA (cytidine/uridine-2'-O-)-methyltransferase
MKSVHVILFQPEIPQNTGNIARTCAAAGVELHLIKPLGFSTDDRYLKRAGLDYWHLVKVSYHDCLDGLFKKYPDGNFAFITKRASQTYDQIPFSGDVFLVFGSETGGLPEGILSQNRDRCFRIPMITEARSLNLSNAVAVVVYEAFRQNDFKNLIIYQDREGRED